MKEKIVKDRLMAWKLSHDSGRPWVQVPFFLPREKEENVIRKKEQKDNIKEFDLWPGSYLTIAADHGFKYHFFSPVRRKKMLSEKRTEG